MHRESGIHEVRRRIVQYSESVSKVTAKSSTHAEFASWTSGSFQSRSENSRRPAMLHMKGLLKVEKAGLGVYVFIVQGSGV